jgi:hypothetical protein
VKPLFRTNSDVIISIKGQRPYPVSRELYSAMNLRPLFDDLPTEWDLKQSAADAKPRAA